jgi:hypothetical protein
VHQPGREHHFHRQSFPAGHTMTRQCRTERANHPEHGPTESNRANASDQSPDDVARNSLPREVAPHRESQRDCRIQMRSADCTHKIDDRHDHQSRRHHHHAQGCMSVQN